MSKTREFVTRVFEKAPKLEPPEVVKHMFTDEQLTNMLAGFKIGIPNQPNRASLQSDPFIGAIFNIGTNADTSRFHSSFYAIFQSLKTVSTQLECICNYVNLVRAPIDAFITRKNLSQMIGQSEFDDEVMSNEKIEVFADKPAFNGQNLKAYCELTAKLEKGLSNS